MKKLFCIAISLIFTFSLMAQPDTVNVKQGKVEVIEQPGKTIVKIGNGEVLTIEEGNDTTRVRFGKRGVVIVEDEKGTKVDMKNLETEEFNFEKEDDDDKKKKKSKFKPHWAGFEIGLNNYVNNDMSMSLIPANSFMDLNTGRSWNFNLNFMEYGLGFGTDKVGLVTGLGLEWNNYHFDQNNNIMVNDEGRIEEYVPDIVAEGGNLDKSKLQTTYLTMPLLLEFQIPAGKKRVFINGGVIGGVKLGSKTKMVYRENGNKQKDKLKDDFNLSSIRYGFTVRAGYRGLKLHGTYYPTSLFEEGKGPELYPFSIGLTVLTL